MTLYLIPQIRFDHLRIIFDHFRNSERDRFSIIHNLDSLAHTHNHFHVVLDEKNRKSEAIAYLFD